VNRLVGWLVFNGTFNTSRLYLAKCLSTGKLQQLRIEFEKIIRVYTKSMSD